MDECTAEKPLKNKKLQQSRSSQIMYAYTLQSLNPENNIITVKNNIAAGPLLQLDLAFVMGSGRVENMFSPEDIEIMIQVTGLEVTTLASSEQEILIESMPSVMTKLRLVA